MKKWMKTLLGTGLSLALVFSGLPLTAQAGVSITDLEELAAPTDFPAEGNLHLQVVTDQTISPEGEISYHYEELWLPVAVDQDHKVYGKLETLGGCLGMNVQYFGSTVTVSYHDTMIYLALNDRTAGYYNGLFSACVNMGQSPALLGEVWYVPLDAFFALTDTMFFYDGETTMGKQELYMVPPQETVLDDLADFYKNVYTTYAFNYMKDVGYTQEQQGKAAGLSAFIQYIHGLGALEVDSWTAVAFGGFTEGALEQINNEYIERFMAYLLQGNAEMTSMLVEETVKTMDYVGVFSDIVNEGVMDIEHLSAPARDFQIGGKQFSEWFSDYQRGVGAAKVIGIGTKHMLSFVSLYQNFNDLDEWCLEAASDFYESRSSLQQQTVDERSYKEVKRNIDQYSASLPESMLKEWIRDDLAELLFEVGSMAGEEVLGPVSTASGLWSGGTQLVLGKWLEDSKDFQCGAFGIRYETDAVCAARQKMDLILSGQAGSAALRADTQKELRQAFYHAIKACYVTRYMGCSACSDLLEKYPRIRETQEARNQRLLKLAAGVMDNNKPFGRLPQDLADIAIQEYDHFSNVIFPIGQICGQILSWEDEEPVEGVKVKVLEEDGTILKEFETDEEGWFDEAFEWEGTDANDPGMDQRTLTLQLDHRRDPLILEDIQVQCFHSYLVEGLHVGEKKEEITAYLHGAVEQDGETVLKITRITFAEDTVYFDLPDWHDGTYKTYTAYPEEVEISEETESLQLGKKVTFETLYTQMMPEGSLVGGMARLFSHEDAEMFPPEILKTKLHDASDIQAFVDTYLRLNGEYPTFQIEKVNSLVKSMEPVAVIIGEQHLSE